MKVTKAILLIMIVVLVFVFTIQNRETLSSPSSFRLHLYVKEFATGEVPFYSVLIICFFAGLLISGVLGWIYRFRLQTECKAIKGRLEEKEKELNSLRNLPVLESQDQGEEAPTTPPAGDPTS
jgi:uncharacterized integral membrane protein